MIKKIAFFTVGFAFNRLNRMRFYERIFPKSTKIYLITTNRYKGKEKESYQQEYTGLKRTKIIKLDYNALKLPFKLRKICKEEKIDRIFNLGFHTGGAFLLPATLGTKTKYVLNVLTDIFNQYRLAENKKESIKEILTLFAMFPLVCFAEKVIFTDKLNSVRAPIFFMKNRKKVYHLAAPVNTTLFTIKNKESLRKKFKIPNSSKVVIFVGRINYLKCSDILFELIKSNPDVYFILIGRMMDKKILNLKVKNFIHYEKKSSEELVDYYNVSDFSFCLNRGGGGLGLSTGEALACGIPVMVSKEFKVPNGSAVFQIETDSKKAQKTLSSFFELSKKARANLAKKAREYVVDNYSDIAWSARYIEAYLN